MDCSPPGSSVHGLLQARILEWVAISFSRESNTKPTQRILKRQKKALPAVSGFVMLEMAPVSTRWCKGFASSKISEWWAEYTITQVTIPFHTAKLSSVTARSITCGGNLPYPRLTAFLSAQWLKRENGKNPPPVPHLKCLWMIIKIP